METCIISIFTIIGFITTCAAVYMFAVDQWGIYKIDQKWKKATYLKRSELVRASIDSNRKKIYII